MHYKDGTEAKLGDYLRFPDGEVGVMVGGCPDSTACNVTAVVHKARLVEQGVNPGPAHIDFFDTKPAATVGYVRYGTAGECELVARQPEPKKTTPL